jgi:hypothetical protein
MAEHISRRGLLGALGALLGWTALPDASAQAASSRRRRWLRFQHYPRDEAGEAVPPRTYGGGHDGRGYEPAEPRLVYTTFLGGTNCPPAPR